MFDLSSQYAIRAMIHLAGLESGRLVQAHIMAKELGLPAPYLSKILQQMVKDGLTISRKGPSGGFALARKPGEIRLYDIIASFQNLHHVDVSIVNEGEGITEPCPLSAYMTSMRENFVDTMKSMTIEQLVQWKQARLGTKRTSASTNGVNRLRSTERELAG